ncbi:glucan endo-1,3-beta-glucosidase 4-like [Mangifera indica]|uniref:glucan endo-1,3-beta-glucosidase 4-like n=1 Tax=Mangifera indica TaxID=29780 RepID=UPI001CFB1A43|nr:glucan endo-1,3-beta-glucosidase 4-like [Mangifera indica]
MRRMSTILPRLMLALVFMLLISPKRDGQDEQWCIADEQTPDSELQQATDWACGAGGANCTNIQVSQPCYYPNTVKDHASYAFNSYFQKYRSKGGSCYFKGAAMITELDPSYNSCRYDYTP